MTGGNHDGLRDRLSAADVGFLYRESATVPMHVATVALFHTPSGGLDDDTIATLIERRLAQEPRYRQRLRQVPGRLANPVWVDDEDFDLSYHVRRSGLPRPGTLDQLLELVGRVTSRQLDRARPLWELYLVEGLDGGDRFAVIAKTHHALATRPGTRDIMSLLLAPSPSPAPAIDVGWEPRREPSAIGLVAAAVAESLRRPTQVLDTLRAEAVDVRAAAGRVLGAAGGVATVVRSSLRPPPTSPLDVVIGEQRRFGVVTTDLDVYRRVRAAHGGTINDVVLATVAGALRTWLLTRGESVTAASTLRALVPVSVGEPADATTSSRLSALFVDLPVGEPSAVVRLHRVAYATKAHAESGRSVPAHALTSLSGFAPPTIHSAAARFGARISRRLFNVVVTNVPGPQFPLYLDGARMMECYPVVPLAPDRALAVGVTSYDGHVFYGLNVDRDALPDVDVMAQCIEESLEELGETVR